MDLKVIPWKGDRHDNSAESLLKLIQLTPQNQSDSNQSFFRVMFRMIENGYSNQKETFQFQGFCWGYFKGNSIANSVPTPSIEEKRRVP